MTAVAKTCPKCHRRIEGVPQPRHRLACGDSRDEGLVLRLLDDGHGGTERVRMVWTDPPFGVVIVGGNHALSREERLELGGKTIQNDNLSHEDLASLLRGALGLAARMCLPGASWYVAAPSGELLGIFFDVLRELQVWRHSLVWLKNSLVLGRCDFHYRHETILYGWVPGGAHYWCGRRDLDSIHEFDRPSRSEDHPTMKPVALVAFHIECSSEQGWLVLDPFCGSGTTLVACQQTGRRGRGVELDPKYADVIRRRMTRLLRERGLAAGPGALDDAQPADQASAG